LASKAHTEANDKAQEEEKEEDVEKEVNSNIEVKYAVNNHSSRDKITIPLLVTHTDSSVNETIDKDTLVNKDLVVQQILPSFQPFMPLFEHFIVVGPSIEVKTIPFSIITCVLQ
jgi:hypothetical protein